MFPKGLAAGSQFLQQVQALKDKVLQSKLTEARRSAGLTAQCPDPDLVENPGKPKP